MNIRSTIIGLALLSSFALGVWGADSEPLTRAGGLFKNRQYNDVIRVLTEAVKGRPESEHIPMNVWL